MGARKFYIDSRKRVSGSHSDFDYQLPLAVQLPKSRMFVDAVHLANVFPTITSHSRYLYIEEHDASNVATKRKVALTVGRYDGDSLATEVTLQLNTGTTLTASSYTCVFNPLTGKLTLSNSSASPADFTIWPADHLIFGLWDATNSPSIADWVEGDDCYEALGFVGTTLLVGNASTPIVASGHVNMQGSLHSIFLHSDLGLQGDALGPDNSQSVIRRVVIDQPPGGMVNDFHSLPYDFVTVQPGQVRNMHFRLADYRGRTVDMSNMGVGVSSRSISSNI